MMLRFLFPKRTSFLGCFSPKIKDLRVLRLERSGVEQDERELGRAPGAEQADGPVRVKKKKHRAGRSHSERRREGGGT